MQVFRPGQMHKNPVINDEMVSDLVEEQKLDAIRQLVIINGMNDKETARQYFSNMVRNRSLFTPLANF